MRLFLSGWEADLVERALREMPCNDREDNEKVEKLLERMDQCKSLQKHH